MSLADQLRRLAVPVTSSYASDSVRRKSLVYDDPSKVDTLQCYQDSLKTFEKLCTRDKMFQQFRHTLFSETSCRLEMCNLLPKEKELLDAQISRFLCFISSHLRHSEALQSLEWLIHKFQIHIFHIEDIMRCVMPYHETGIFPKFLQLIDFRQCPPEFLWMKPFADHGKSLTRPQLVRECVRQHGFVPFISSMLSNSIKLCKDLPSSYVSDMTNFFVSLIAALCDAGHSDEKLAGVVDGFQHVIRSGLRALDSSVVQSAMCLVIMRLSLKLSLNQELVLTWIGSLLKRTKPSNAWQSLRVVIRLMRSQHIALLPEHLTVRQASLMTHLSPSERAMIEEEEAGLLASVDADKLASDAAKQSVTVKAATTPMDIDQSSTNLETKSATPTAPPTSVMDECEQRIKVANALVASLVDDGPEKCILQDDQCSCPLLADVQCEPIWLCDLLSFVLPSTEELVAVESKRPSKRVVTRARRIIRLTELAVQAHLKACQSTTGSPRKTRSTTDCGARARSSSTFSPSERLLESGLDRGLPMLIACLLHPAASVRIDVYRVLCHWFRELVRLRYIGNARLTQALHVLGLNVEKDAVASVDAVLEEETCELLRGDRLSALTKVTPKLVRLAIRLLFSEPLSESSANETKYAISCWAHGLSLLSEDTAVELLRIPQSTPATNNVGWSGFLHLVRAGFKTPKLALLHMHCISVITGPTYRALRASSTNLSQRERGTSSDEAAQFQLLDALYDWALGIDASEFHRVTAVFNQLDLEVTHFDHILQRLGTIGSAVGKHGTSKSLYERVTESREARRRHHQLQLTHPDASNTMETSTAVAITDSVTKAFSRHATPHMVTASQLRLLASLLGILTSAVDRLQMSSTTRPEPVPSREVTQLTPSLAIRGESFSQISLVDDCAYPSSTPKLMELLQPLVSHLVSLLSQEQRLIKHHTSHQGLAETDDSEDDSDTDETTPPTTTVLPIDLDESLKLTSAAADNNDADDLTHPCVRRLTRQCVYRLLVSMTCLLAATNQTASKLDGSKRDQTRRLDVTCETIKNPTATTDHIAQVAMDPVFQCLAIFTEWTALHHQVLLCLIELVTMFPVVLCQRLLGLVHWIASNRQLMRLDNVHSLALLGRLVVVAVPNLVRASSNQTNAALQVLVLFADGLPSLPSRMPRRRLAFYTGLVRGLAQVTGPLSLTTSTPTLLSINSPGCGEMSEKRLKRLRRRQQRLAAQRCKESWIGSWLWVTALVFLNRDWQDSSVADQVVPLLIDLHNQFAWDKQVTAWYECLTFLLWINKYIAIPSGNEDGQSTPAAWTTPAQPLKTRKLVEVVDTEIAPPPKRSRRISTSSAANPDDSDEEVTQSPVTEVQFHLPQVTASLRATLFAPSSTALDATSIEKAGEEKEHSASATNSTMPPLNPASMWSLTGRAVQLLVTLLSDPTYDHKLQVAVDDPLGLGAVYGRLVQQVVQLMLDAASTLTKCKSTTEGSVGTPVDGAKLTLTGLQKVLIQIHNSVSSNIFIRMVSDLFDSVHGGLRRKALELLAAKLQSLTDRCKPLPILPDPAHLPVGMSGPRSQVTGGGRKRRAPEDSEDFALDSGLVQLTAQLAAQYNNHSRAATRRKATAATANAIEVHAYGSAFSRQSLSCLRDLAKLLADRYPGEFMRTLDILLAQPLAWWPSKESEEGKEARGSGFAESRSLVCLFFVECLQRLPTQTLAPDASVTSQRLGAMLLLALEHSMISCRLAQTPALTMDAVKSLETSDVTESTAAASELVAGSIHSRDQHLQAGLTLLQNLLELAAIHRCAQPVQSTAMPNASNITRGNWLQFAPASDSAHVAQHKHTVHSEPLRLSDHLMQFLFRLGQLDLATATGVNAERSGSTLRQIQIRAKQIRQILMCVTDVPNLLRAVQRVLSVSIESSQVDATLLLGSLLFLGDFSEAAKPSSNDSTGSTRLQLHQELNQLAVTQPDVIEQLFMLVLKTTVASHPAMEREFTQTLQSASSRALATLLAAIPSDLRLRLSQKLFTWATIKTGGNQQLETSVVDVLRRLGTVYHVMADLSSRLEADTFTELSKQLSLVDYLVLTFHIVTGQKQKGLSKLADRFNLKSCLGHLADGVNRDVLDASTAAISCLRHWLQAEHESATCLDAASGGSSVLDLPVAFISLLDLRLETDETLGDPPITDIQLGEAMDALIDCIATDEALLRPIGAALASRILHGGHWATRLAAIRLLKRAFDRILSVHEKGTGSVTTEDQLSSCTAQCLVSDALSALSEALEDDRPEVEAAANKLFAQLEQSGLSGRKLS